MTNRASSNRVADVPQSCNRARPQIASVHERCIELTDPVGRDHCAMPGIEERIVLERVYCRGDCVQARAARGQDCFTRSQGLFQTGVILGFAPCRQLAAGNITGAAVDGNRMHRAPSWR